MTDFVVDMTNRQTREMVHLLQCRSMLKIEIMTGMSHSRGSVLVLCQRMNWTKKRTKRGAYADLDALIVERGGESRPLP